jgi:hypothetical protein
MSSLIHPTIMRFMADAPRPLTAAERRARRERAARIARGLGFVGKIEYRHVYSQTGGAQYGRARVVAEDLLIVYAEAFDRDVDPDDFSLAAIVAHEVGHQLLARHPRISKIVEGRISLDSEEILASLLGGLICTSETDRQALVAKATAELLNHGEPLDIAMDKLQELWDLFEETL